MSNNFKKITENKKFNFILNIVFLFVILLLIIFNFDNHDLRDSKKIIREQDENYSLTNPILDCENVDQTETAIISSIKVNKKVLEVKEAYDIEEISLYYRDLNNGPWLGVNEEEKFSPASLLKIPVAMALFKYAEDNSEILDKKIIVSSQDIVNSNNQNIKFEDVLREGKEYSLLQVLESMIKKSDNTAVSIILNNIPEEYIDGVFHSIGVPYQDTQNEVSLRVKDYAAFFRVLFNSSYLDREMSEKLLEILSDTEYKNGIVGGIIDKNIKISHKFGERSMDNIYQLHDCGIVYHSENPYLICVMTRGDSFYKQQLAIQGLSKFIYDEVNKSY